MKALKHLALRGYAAYLAGKTRRALADPRATQTRLLLETVRTFAPTAVGKKLGLGEVRSVADFRARVSVTTYDDYEAFFRQVYAENPPDLVMPGRVKYLARTSGTMNKSKLNGFAPALVKAFNDFQTRLALHHMRETGRYDLLDTFLLTTVGSPQVETLENGLTVGWATGIITALAPPLASRIVRPSRPILEMSVWADKIEATVREAMPLDVRVMIGIPLYVVPILERMLAYAREQGRPVANLGELWPNLGVYFWSGSPITAYEERLRVLFGPNVHFREAYSCTEGPVAYQWKLREPGLLLDIEHCYFEFQPVGSPLDAPRLGVWEVEVGKPYRMLMTTPGGYFAYFLGDTIGFVSTSPPLIRFLGRELEELNFGFEKMPLTAPRAALAEVAAKHGVRYDQWFIAPSLAGPGSQPGYHWYIEFETEPADKAAFVADLDDALKADHPIYLGQRKRFLDVPQLTCLPPGTVTGYVLDHREFGQGKFLQLYNDRRVADAIEAKLTG